MNQQISTAEAAAIIGSSQRFVANLARRGIIRAVQSAGPRQEWLLDRGSVVMYALTTPVKGAGQGSGYRPLMTRSRLERLRKDMYLRWPGQAYEAYHWRGLYLAFYPWSEGASEASAKLEAV